MNHVSVPKGLHFPAYSVSGKYIMYQTTIFRRLRSFPGKWKTISGEVMKGMALLFICLMVFMPAFAQVPDFEWAKSMGGTGNDQSIGMVVDAAGNIYITGFLAHAGGDFNPGGTGGALTSAGSSDAYIAKYDPQGNYLWGKSMGGSGADRSTGIAVDAAGNVYITGYISVSGGDFNPGGTGGSLTSAGNNDIFIAKYAPNGNYLWAKSMGGTGNEAANGIAVDAAGNIYIAGYLAVAGGDFNPGGTGGVVTATGAGDEVFLAKYDLNGNYLWAKSMGGAARDVATGVAVDASGNVYITGSTYGGNFNPGGTGGTLTVAGGEDWFLAKYAPNGDYLWGKTMGGTSGVSEAANGVAVDATGNVYVTGYIAVGAADFNPGGTGGALTAVGTNSVVVAKYAPNGNYLWAKSLGGTGIDRGTGVAADAAGNVYITGQLSATGGDFNPGGPGGALTSAGGNDVFIAKYALNGDYIWAKSMGGTGNDIPNRVVVDAAANVYITGYIPAAGADFNPGGTGGALTSAGNNDVFLLKLSQGGGCMPTASVITETACNSFTFKGTAITASGIYYDTLTNTAGCDSVVTLNLTVNTTSAYTENMTICSNELPYTWNGKVVQQGGAAVETYTTQNSGGCDSVVTLNLTVNATSAYTENLTICSNELPYTWNGKVVQQGGAAVETYTTPNSAGCDSVVTLNLIVNPATDSTVEITICSDDLPYTWNGQTLMQGGSAVATYTTTNSTGCDSTVTLNLTVEQTTVPQVIVIATPDYKVAPDTPVTFAAWVSNAGTSPAIVWRKNGAQVGTGGISYTDNNLQNGDIITCTVYSTFACSRPDSVVSEPIVMEISTGIARVHAVGSDLRMYPNPNNGSFTIEGTLPGNSASVDMISLTGQVVYHSMKMPVRNGQLKAQVTHQLAPGIYLLRVASEGMTHTLRFTVTQ